MNPSSDRLFDMSTDKLLANMVAQARDAMFAIRLDGHILYANPAAEALYGFSLIEVQHACIQDLLAAGDREEMSRRLQDSREAGQCYRTTHRRKDGTIFPVEVNSRLIHYLDSPVLVGIVRDLTHTVALEMKIAQQNRQSKHRYQAVFNQTYAGICLMEVATSRIQDINPAESEICGFADPQSVLGKHKYELLGEYPFSEKEYRQYFAQACQGLPQVFAWCYQNKGNTKYVEISLSRIPIGDSFAILSLSRDITARRMDELELVKARASNLALIQAIPDTILVIRQDGSLAERWISEQDAAVFGNGDWQQHLADLFPGEVVYTVSAAMKRAHEQKSVQLAEFWLPGEESSCFYEARLTVSGADEIVLILRNATAHKRLHEQMVRHSTLDSMTELNNRHFFEEQLANCVEQSAAAVLICDVDGLKTINDTLGRQAGDRVLKTVACFLLDVFSAQATIARIGGGEFAVLLIGDIATKVEALCDALKQRVEMHNNACPSLPVSISTGFACQKKMAINGEVLFAEADNNMYREKMHQHKSGKNAVVQTLIKALEARDYITEGHCDRVQKQLVMLAEAAGVAKTKKHDLKLFAQFHDIGKVGIPDSILFKPFGLTPEEWQVMQGHCEIGHRIARASSHMAPIADWILKHHEWWNGKGYPQGIAGDAIPVECRLLAIVDAYDAMTNDRPYRKAMSRQDAIAELKRAAGSQFDPQLVELFAGR